MIIEDQVLALINQTNQNVFLTGRAGTGKTTLLKKIVTNTHKSYIIVAPTGVAAINAGGVTIHSMFQLPLNGFLPTDYHYTDGMSVHFDNRKTILRHFRTNRIKRAIFQNLELLIIDEVSMLRPDTLDAMDLYLQVVRHNKKPFGGVQVLFIGDLQQLPPIIRNQEWEVMSQYYSGKYFFYAKAIQEQPIYIELTKIYRQDDEDFIFILQKLRDQALDEEVLMKLNEHIDPDFDIRDNEGYIVLTTHNAQADQINQRSLAEIDSEIYQYDAEVIDEFPESSYPIESKLILKMGAQVMFTKNDQNFDRRYYNGKIGKIVYLDNDEIIVYLKEENKRVTVDKHTWENIRYTTNAMTGEIEETVHGTFTQYPLRLAYAITVHKSQGLTFEKCAMNISQVFAPGQAYVALSRLTKLSGLKLLTPVENRNLTLDRDILAYANNKIAPTTLSDHMVMYSKDYILEVCLQSFDYRNIEVWRKEILKELEQSGIQSTWKKNEKWLHKLLFKLNEISEVAIKFKHSIPSVIQQPQDNFSFLKERIEKAYLYFESQWMPLYEDILRILHELQFQTKVREFEDEMLSLESIVFQHIKMLLKTKKLVLLISQNLPIDKFSLQVNELESIKRSLQSKFHSEHAGSLKSLADKKSKSSKEKKITNEKKTTQVISLDLWKEHRSIEKIVEIRKLTTSTIFGHLSKFVEIGELDIHELIDSSRYTELEQNIQNIPHFDSIGELKTALDDKYDYAELKLFIAHQNYTKSLSRPQE